MLAGEPLAVNDLFAVSEDAPLQIAAPGVLLNDTGSGPLSATVALAPQHGELKLAADGSFHYQPDANFFGEDSFTYQASDGKASSTPATVKITVLPVADDKATPTPDVYFAQQDTPLLAAGLGPSLAETGFNDVAGLGAVAGDNAPYAIGAAIAGQGSGEPGWVGPWVQNNGAVAKVSNDALEGDGALLLLPTGLTARQWKVPDPNAPFSFEMRMKFTPSAYISLYLFDGESTLTEFNADAVGGPQLNIDEAGNVGVMDGGDSEASGFHIEPGKWHTFTFQVDPASHSYRFFFDHVEAPGPDPFNFRGGPAKIDSIAFIPQVSGAGILVDGLQIYGGHQTPGVLANEINVDALPLAAQLEAGPLHAAAFKLNADGTFAYTPAAGFIGQDTFTYRMQEGDTLSDPVAVTILVEDVQYAPQAKSDAFSLGEGSTLKVSEPLLGLLANDSDADGDPLVVQLADGPAHGQLKLNADGTFAYTPAVDFAGVDHFTYRAFDGKLASAATTVELTVTKIDRTPVAVNDAYPMTEDGVLEGENLLTNDQVPTPGPVPSVEVSVPGPTNLWLAGLPDGSTASVLDSAPAQSPTLMNGLAVIPGQALRFSATGGVSNGVSESSSPEGRNDFVQHGSGAENGIANVMAPLNSLIAVFLGDESPAGQPTPAGLDFRTTSFNVPNGVNYGEIAPGLRQPFFIGDGLGPDGTPQQVRVPQGATRLFFAAMDSNAAFNNSGDFAVKVSDPTVVSSSAVLVAGPTHGQLELNADGSFRYTPAPDYFGPDSFQYKITSRYGESAPATVSIAVQPQLDPPRAYDDAYLVRQNTPLSTSESPLVLNDDLFTHFPLAGVVDSRWTMRQSTSLERNGNYVPLPQRSDDSFEPNGWSPDPGETFYHDPARYLWVGANTTGQEMTLANNHWPAGTVALHPPGTGLIVVTWTAPEAGLAELEFAFSDANSAGATGQNWYVEKNDSAQTLAQGLLEEGGDTGSLRRTVLVAAGDRINFVVDANGNYTLDTLVLRAQVRLQVDAGSVLSNDWADEAATLTAALATPPAHGQVVLHPDGGFTYTPAAGYLGADEFTYVVTDGVNQSAPATMQLIVAPQLIDGDVDGDRQVDLSDFGLLKKSFGLTPAFRSQGDLNGDHKVDLSDFGVLKNNFGRQGNVEFEVAAALAAASTIPPLPAGDATPPTMTILEVAPDPHGGPVDAIQIVFSEPISGFELSDLVLDLQNDGLGSLLTPTQTLLTPNAVHWTLGGLSSITAAQGRYSLGLRLSGANIVDLAGNPLQNSPAEFWLNNGGDTTNPTVDILDVAPDPRGTPVDEIEIVFSEPVTGFQLSDLNLDRAADGAGNLLTGAQTLSTLDNITWRLGNLSPVTTFGGQYSLTFFGNHGITDLGSNPLIATVAEVWLKTIDDSVPPTVDVVNITPDPRGTPVSQATIVFSEPVTGFDLGDLNLDRSYDGLSNLLTGAQTLTTADNITWTLGNLTGVTTNSGQYVLSVLTTGGIRDAGGNLLAATASDIWTKNDGDVAPPTVADIVDVSPDPRATGVNQISIVFSEPVTGFDVGDLNLDRAYDGLGNLLTGAQTLTTSDNITWTLGNLAELNSAEGLYVLSFKGGSLGVVDAAGNVLAGPLPSEQWRVTADLTPPTGDIVNVAPDPRTTAVDSLTIVFSKAVAGFQKSDLILDRSFDGLGSLIGAAQTLTTTDNITWTLGNLGPITGLDGDYTVYLRSDSGITDLFGNPLSGAVVEQWTKNAGDAIVPVADAFAAVDSALLDWYA